MDEEKTDIWDTDLPNIKPKIRTTLRKYVTREEFEERKKQILDRT